MGVNNRQRRRAKQQRRWRAERARRAGPERLDGTGGDGGRSGRLDDRAVREAVLAAAQAYRFESPAAYQSHLDTVATVEGVAGPQAVDDAIAWWTDRGLDRAWGSGWQPADVVRAVRRTLGAGHAQALAPAVAASAARRPEATGDERWAGQVATIAPHVGRSPVLRPRAEAVALAVEVVSLLLDLPPLPRLSTPACGAKRDGRAASAAMLERVRALLAKAESTTFPEEAEALTTKAQELMARHAIDEAMLEIGGEAGPGEVVGWRIHVEDPYAGAKSILLGHIAKANRCRAVWSSGLGIATVFGAPSDLEMVEVLFTSLLVQATEAMVGAGRRVDGQGRSRTRSFRHSFLLAYAARIGERLAAATASVVAEGAARHGDALLPVLAGREEAVEEAVRAAFPRLVHRDVRIGNYSGWVAGRAAAELASLAVGDPLASGGAP